MTRSCGSLLSFVLVLVALPVQAQNPQQATGDNSPVTFPLQGEQLTSQIAEVELHLVELRKIYKESFPEIRSVEVQLQLLAGQLAALEKQVTTLNEQIAAVESQLANLRKTYKESFPEIRELKMKLQALQDQRDALVK